MTQIKSIENRYNDLPLEYQNEYNLASKFFGLDYSQELSNFLYSATAYQWYLILIYNPKLFSNKKFIESIDKRGEEKLAIALKNLSSKELSIILYSLSEEDKKYMYNSFPNLEFVNKLLNYDDNKLSYMDDITDERKKELLVNSEDNTKETSKMLYDSLDKDDQKEVISEIGADSSIVSVDNTNNNELDESKTINNKAAMENKMETQELEKETNEEITEQEDNSLINDFVFDDVVFNSLIGRFNLDKNVENRKEFYQKLTPEQKLEIEQSFLKILSNDYKNEFGFTEEKLNYMKHLAQNYLKEKNRKESKQNLEKFKEVSIEKEKQDIVKIQMVVEKEKSLDNKEDIQEKVL